MENDPLELSAFPAEGIHDPMALALNGERFGSFREEPETRSIRVRLRDGRTFRLIPDSWVGEAVRLVEVREDAPPGPAEQRAQKEGLLAGGWKLRLSPGEARLGLAELFATRREVRSGPSVWAEVHPDDEDGWRVRARRELRELDLLLIGLVHHAFG